MTSTIDIFEDRKDYHNFDGSSIAINDLEDFGDPNPIDLWYDRMYYGRVNEQNEVVFISQETFAKQEKLKMITDDGVYALDFVANAFNDLRRRIERGAAAAGTFGSPAIGKESVIRDITPKRGFEEVDSSYEGYLRSYFDIFMRDYLRDTFRDQQVTNVEDFFKFFSEYSINVARDLPFTKSGFVKSRYCSPMVSGLVLEISFFDHDDDELKGTYIDDISFGYFHSLARKHGFYVDKNAPWRLVANISSPQMQRYWIRGKMDPSLGPMPEPPTEEVDGVIEDCKPILEAETAVEVAAAGEEIELPPIIRYLQPESVQNLFNTYYNKAYAQDIHFMGLKLIEYYNEYVSMFPQVVIEKKKSCAHKIWLAAGSPTAGNTVLSRKNVVRSHVTEQDLAAYSSVVLFGTYIKLRAAEERVSLSAPRFNQILKNAKRIYLYIDKMDLDKGETMRYINNEIKGFPPRQPLATKFSLSQEGTLTPSESENGGMP